MALHYPFDVDSQNLNFEGKHVGICLHLQTYWILRVKTSK